MEQHLKEFTIQEDGRELIFLAFRSYTDNLPCVVIRHMLNERDHGGGVKFSIPLSRLIRINTKGPENWNQMLDIAISQFTASDWAQRIIQNPETLVFEDILSEREGSN